MKFALKNRVCLSLFFFLFCKVIVGYKNEIYSIKVIEDLKIKKIKIKE